MRRTFDWQVLFLAKALSQFARKPGRATWRILKFQKKNPVALSGIGDVVSNFFYGVGGAGAGVERCAPPRSTITRALR